MLKWAYKKKQNGSQTVTSSPLSKDSVTQNTELPLKEDKENALKERIIYLSEENESLIKRVISLKEKNPSQEDINTSQEVTNNKKLEHIFRLGYQKDIVLKTNEGYQLFDIIDGHVVQKEHCQNVTDFTLRKDFTTHNTVLVHLEKENASLKEIIVRLEKENTQSSFSAPATNLKIITK
jgi:low affinity Fe/Cu permease